MKILMLASYFPRPSNMTMGTWALAQATAMNRRLPMEVVSLSSYMPSPIGKLGLWKTYSQCPGKYDFDGLIVHYPKWLYYPISPLKDLALSNPRFQVSIGWLSVRASLIALIEKVRPTVVFAHHIATGGYIALRMQELTGLPYVITEHSYSELDDCITNLARKAHYEEIVSRASRVVCVSNRMKQTLRQLFPIAKLETVHNGVDIKHEVCGESVLMNNRKHLVVFSAGFFSERKGFVVLIKAFRKVVNKYPTVTLRIAGDGPERRKILKTIQELGLQDRVVLLGSVRHETVLKEMRGCDIFVLPSWQEPFGVVFIEAMESGKPIICTSDCGITDVVEDGEHGLVITSKDEVACAEALIRLIEDASSRLRIGANAQKLVAERLSWDKNIESMTRIFGDACCQS